VRLDRRDPVARDQGTREREAIGIRAPRHDADLLPRSARRLDDGPT